MGFEATAEKTARHRIAGHLVGTDHHQSPQSPGHSRRHRRSYHQQKHSPQGIVAVAAVVSYAFVAVVCAFVCVGCGYAGVGVCTADTVVVADPVWVGGKSAAVAVVVHLLIA